MTIFSSVEEAQRYGFHWLEYQPHHGMHLVEIVRIRRDGRRERSLAFALDSSARGTREVA